MLVSASPHVTDLVKQYDALLEETFRARHAFAYLAQVLINPVGSRFSSPASGQLPVTLQRRLLHLP